jgi:molybdopterin molybdotransferase
VAGNRVTAARITGDLLSLEEAQARLIALANPLPPQHVAATAALGRYLAEDCHAALTRPAADLSAMDGYAICGNGPWRRIGESRAGTPFAGTLAPGECVRISTGAHLPQGSDRVVFQEEAAVSGDHITAAAVPPAGCHVRPRGFDFAAGDRVLTGGMQMTPARIALAIAAGLSMIAVGRSPKVAILDTGDELASDRDDCGDHQIPASNGAMLAAMLRNLGCDAVQLGPVGDDRATLAAALAAAEPADLLVTSGGASVGDHDLVQPALADWGAQLAFWKVAIKPGKPMLVATRGQQLIMGLPGNPVSCFVTAFLFVLPAVRAMMGAAQPLPQPHPMVTGDDLPASGKRREFLRASCTGGKLHLAGSQDSSALMALAAADWLIDRPAASPALAGGAQVFAYPLHIG